MARQRVSTAAMQTAQLIEFRYHPFDGKLYQKIVTEEKSSKDLGYVLLNKYGGFGFFGALIDLMLFCQWG